MTIVIQISKLLPESSAGNKALIDLVSKEPRRATLSTITKNAAYARKSSVDQSPPFQPTEKQRAPADSCTNLPGKGLYCEKNVHLITAGY